MCLQQKYENGSFSRRRMLTTPAAHYDRKIMIFERALPRQMDTLMVQEVDSLSYSDKHTNTYLSNVIYLTTSKQLMELIVSS